MAIAGCTSIGIWSQAHSSGGLFGAKSSIGAEVVAKAQAVLSEAALLRAMFNFA
jgi:hypothetical protein